MSAIAPTQLTSLEANAKIAASTCTFTEPSARPPIAAVSPARSSAKRALDLVGASVGLFFLAPVMTAIALMIRLESRGPAFFRQTRMGLGGRTFLCLKFRTMVPDAEAQLRELEGLNESVGGVLFKIKDDPRVTRLGRVLRRTSLDELPQLWNVLVGEMSLVGPRPLQLRDCEKLEALDPDGFARRLAAVPGVTGPWQVGGRSEVDSRGMMDLDLDYVEGWSLGLDLRILFRTIWVVLARTGAC